MKTKLVLTTLGVLALITACGQIPLGSVSANGKVTQGVINPGLSSSTFSFAVVGTGVKCTGTSTPAGESRATCNDGTAITFDIPKGQYGKLDGWYFSQDGNGFGPTVSGWGKYADEKFLRETLAEYL